LSLPITVVEPRVSTAGSLRMIARRWAILLTPIASVMVTAAGSPSGMAATARAIDAVNMSGTCSPRSSPTAKVTAPSARITTSSTVENCAILRVSGVFSSSASEMRREIRPTSVWSPVATTMPVAVPLLASDEA
jgi:hypothetical protein